MRLGLTSWYWITMATKYSFQEVFPVWILVFSHSNCIMDAPGQSEPHLSGTYSLLQSYSLKIG